MKFTCSTEINLPINRVTSLFFDPDNLKYWQEGFISYDHIRGIPGEPGAKSKIILEHRNKRMELIETIIFKNLPYEMDALYEHKHMVNTLANRFILIDKNKTRYEAHVEYMKFHGLVPRLMAFFMPLMFKRQTQKWVNRFKEFAEERGKPLNR
ncbi:MAG TPA: SRPBCC family protein [Ferruginibacter sp.]|nr:SRPBCC family protein [Ferruginibacter sp.]